jgi:predicted pyridoxine 5'-phosphate oxidase superfamily flavin-nucleotide-binding protein
MNGAINGAAPDPAAQPPAPECAPAVVPVPHDSVPPSPWHAGEVAMQRLAGVAEKMDSVGRKVVRPYMPDQHRDFFAQLPFAVLGAVDGAGDVWATLRSGPPGFLHSPGPRVLDVRLPRVPDDPADAGLDDGGDVALLGIELHTRRRNRMNGVLRRGPDGDGHIDVLQSFGNCPQYIQLRDMQLTNQVSAQPEWLPALDAAATQLVAQADTFYVASYAGLPDGRRQVDVSHRGGLPGFVRVEADGALTVPEFAGNLFFNKLGNFTVNPRAGLVFVDFEQGHLLQMTGDVRIFASLPDGAALEGAQRYWRFTPRRVVWRRGALGLRWRARQDGVSPAALRTGAWRPATAPL